MLSAFNHGDLHAYDALCVKHANALNAQPALVAHERKLREKITILCLMELIFTYISILCVDKSLFCAVNICHRSPLLHRELIPLL